MQQDGKGSVSEAARERNEAFAQVIATRAMDVIREKITKEKEQGDLNCEVYYSIHNPYEEGSAEYVYIQDLLTKSSGKDPNYIDLFDRLRIKLKEALDCEGVHSFLMLNCRFDARYEDNFLLYALVSWGG
ncbi:hypothetical protein LJC49_07965 [Ruminococcaceae bacterium OttesenSCG-928-I18]|nr:hypothetical protein [Ruminococcaceae bacterium OttesenSCG-928-I18]